MHHEKEVTSQVFRDQRNQRGTSAQVPAQSIGVRCYYADTLSYLENKGSSFARVKYFRDKRLRLNSLNLTYELGGCKVRKNEVPGHAQTCDVLYITFQRRGNRDIA